MRRKINKNDVALFSKWKKWSVEAPVPFWAALWMRAVARGCATGFCIHSHCWGGLWMKIYTIAQSTFWSTARLLSDGGLFVHHRPIESWKEPQAVFSVHNCAFGSVWWVGKPQKVERWLIKKKKGKKESDGELIAMNRFSGMQGPDGGYAGGPGQVIQGVAPRSFWPEGRS